MSADERSTAIKAFFANTDSPAKLLRLFAALSVLSVVSILALAGVGIHHVVSNEMIRVAEHWAVHVANMLFENERETFLGAKGDSRSVAVAPEDFEGLDRRMRKSLLVFDMHKIKAFAVDTRIVYSTDHGIIGRIEADNAKLDLVLRTGAVVSKLEHKENVRDLKGEERLRRDVVECYVPIHAGERIVGAFEVYVDITATQARILASVHWTLLVLAVVLVGVFGLLYLPMRRGSLRLKKAEDRLTELAATDGLTGIYNRRHLLHRVREERVRMLRARAEPPPRQMAFLMLDIDHFKRINDTYGHPAGDAVLQEVARRLKSSLRSYDVLGRYGGEEFLVVLPNSTLAAACTVAEHLHGAVRAQPIDCVGAPITVTVSIGVTTTAAPDEDPTHAIARADAALYAAKEAGRDCIQVAETPEIADAARNRGRSLKLAG